MTASTPHCMEPSCSYRLTMSVGCEVVGGRTGRATEADFGEASEAMRNPRPKGDALVDRETAAHPGRRRVKGWL